MSAKLYLLKTKATEFPMPLKLRNLGFGSHDALPETPKWVGKFFTRSRTMSNYIYRNFSAPDLEMIKPSGIEIWMHHSPKENVYEINGSQFVDIPARTQETERFMAEDTGTPEFFFFLSELLDEGLVKLEKQSGFPRNRINKVAKSFIDRGVPERLDDGF